MELGTLNLTTGMKQVNIFSLLSYYVRGSASSEPAACGFIRFYPRKLPVQQELSAVQLQSVLTAWMGLQITLQAYSHR